VNWLIHHNLTGGSNIYEYIIPSKPFVHLVQRNIRHIMQIRPFGAPNNTKLLYIFIRCYRHMR
jgi:hypothetical protein